MNDNIKEFLEKIAEDPDLQARFSQIRDPDEAYAFASSIQPGFTKEDLWKTISSIRDTIENTPSDEDLAKSAGGGRNDILISAVSILS